MAGEGEGGSRKMLEYTCYYCNRKFAKSLDRDWHKEAFCPKRPMVDKNGWPVKEG